MKKIIFGLAMMISISAFAAEVCEVGTQFANYQGKFVASLRCTNYDSLKDLKVFYRANGWRAQSEGTETCHALGLACGDIDSQVETFEAADSVLIKKTLLNAGYVRQSSNSGTFETYIKN